MSAAAALTEHRVAIALARPFISEAKRRNGAVFVSLESREVRVVSGEEAQVCVREMGLLTWTIDRVPLGHVAVWYVWAPFENGVLCGQGLVYAELEAGVS